MSPRQEDDDDGYFTTDRFKLNEKVVAIQKEQRQKCLLKDYEYRSCSEHMHQGFSCAQLNMLHMSSVIKTSLLIYLPVHIIPVLIFKRKALMERPLPVLRKLLLGLARSVAWLVAFQGLFIATVCLGNRIFKHDSIVTASLSGFIAGVAVMFEQASRRKEMMLYCVPRVLEIMATTGMRRKWFKERTIDAVSVLLFILGSGMLMSLYSSNKYRNCVKHSIRSLLSMVI